MEHGRTGRDAHPGRAEPAGRTDHPDRAGAHVFGCGGRPFPTDADDELTAQRPGMMTLTAVAITVAFVASWAATLELASHEPGFRWEPVPPVAITLLGHTGWRRALSTPPRGALDAPATLLPGEAERACSDGEFERIPMAESATGGTVPVRSGGASRRTARSPKAWPSGRANTRRPGRSCGRPTNAAGRTGRADSGR